jgi:hypothetical protein
MELEMKFLEKLGDSKFKRIARETITIVFSCKKNG